MASNPDEQFYWNGQISFLQRFDKSCKRVQLWWSSCYLLNHQDSSDKTQEEWKEASFHLHKIRMFSECSGDSACLVFHILLRRDEVKIGFRLDFCSSSWLLTHIFLSWQLLELSLLRLIRSLRAFQILGSSRRRGIGIDHLALICNFHHLLTRSFLLLFLIVVEDRRFLWFFQPIVIHINFFVNQIHSFY